MKQLFKLILILAILSIAMVSCKKETVINVNGITIVLPPGTGNTLNVGATITVTATVTPADATNKGVTLTSSNPAVISVTETSSGWTIKAESIGSATLTATAKDAGGKTASITLTVSAISGNLTVTVSGSYTYTGAPIVPPAANVTVKLGDATLAAADYTLAYSDNTNASTAAKVTATGKGNYSGTGSGTFTIAPFAVSVKADDISKFVGEADPVLTYTSTPVLLRNDMFTGALTRDPGEVAGMLYDIKQGTLTAGSNYAITFTPGKFTIKAPLLTLAQRIAAAASGDIIYLYSDEDISSNITINKTITLISSDTGSGGIRKIGHTTQGYLFSVASGGKLTLDANVTLDGSGVENNNAPLVLVGANAVFIMKEGSKITGNNNINKSGVMATLGGAVLVYGNGASFVMMGGEITKNSDAEGGAVCVQLGVFTMSGGKIIENTSNYGGDMIVSVYWSTPATFYLSGDAQIGDLWFYANSGTKTSVTLAGEFTGSVASLNLTGDYAVDNVKSYWTNVAVIKAGADSGVTLTKELLDKFPLGKFAGHNNGQFEVITGYHLYGTKTGETNATNMGKFVVD